MPHSARNVHTGSVRGRGWFTTAHRSHYNSIMIFLLTNDDGIHAPGLAALAQAVQPIGDSIVVAPHEHLSGCSHRVTTSQPFRLAQHGVHRYAVEGTPADCIRVAL